MANFVINFILAVSLSILWGMINGLQLLSFLPLANSQMPGNAWFVFNQIYIFASFNVINVDVFTDYISRLLHLDKTDEGLSPRLLALGFESTNVISNLGIVFVFILASAAFLLVAWLLHLLSSIRCGCQQRLKEWYNRLSKKIYWNFFIRLFIETYMDQALVQAVRLRNLTTKPAGSLVMIIVAVIIIMTLVAFPAAGWTLLIKHQSSLGHPYFKEKYQEAYDGLKITHKKALGQNTVMLLKRLTFVAVVMLIDNLMIQLPLLLLLFWAGSVYSVSVRPYEDPVGSF